MAQKVTNSAQEAKKTNAAQTAAKTNAVQTAAKANAAQTTNKTNSVQTAATPAAAPVTNAQTSVHPDYRGTILDAITGDPRDLPQVGYDSQKPYSVVGDNNGFPATSPVVSPGGGSGGQKSSGVSSGYKAAALPSATSQADYINAMYDANEQRRRAALETAYDANVATLDRQSATIAPQYQQAANAAAAQSAVAQAAFNERAAAAGMNTGAGSQAALVQNNALVSGVSAIRQAESEALADVEAKRADLAAQYQKAIAEAVANNEAERAQALYAEAIRVDESLVTTAANQATENFRAWQAKYK